MKKVIAGLFTLGTLTLTVHAYDKVERKHDMQMMETAMAQIQKGILSNNDKMTLQGASNLKVISNKIEIPQNKAELDYKPKYAKKMAKDIMKHVDDISDKIEDGKLHSATASYAEILNKCISCHKKIRAWNY